MLRLIEPSQTPFEEKETMVCVCDRCQLSFIGPSEPRPLLLTVDGCDVKIAIAPKIWKANEFCLFCETSMVAIIDLKCYPFLT